MIKYFQNKIMKKISKFWTSNWLKRYNTPMFKIYTVFGKTESTKKISVRNFKSHQFLVGYYYLKESLI